MALTRLIYFSEYRISVAAKRPMQVLNEILDSSIRNNQPRNVTGALIFDSDWFVQTLEGERADVLAIFKKIEQDKRHAHVTLVEVKSVDERHFGNWWMGALVRNSKTAAIFDPYLRDGRFDPANMTGDEILSLTIALAEAGVGRRLAAA